MNLSLTKEDARFLRSQLATHLQRLEVELAHTEQRAFKASLAADVARLHGIAGHLDHVLEEDLLEEFV
jgi:hypothetical protein